ncbi:MAG TPA: DUF192 domain-containing protein [Anaerolineae bacterium]|nr:DUF192 domain-containing protein [Anaerolineae bacterium]HOR01204.1 DUF192 domain-containing protein [Anaerolineae bacterium]HPL29342.1 DUF192 domain-containing protein [Anaerolineae bacterium]
MKRLLIRNLTQATVVAEGADLADGMFTRLRGLIGRRTLAPGQGLVISPCSSIHTCFMGFPIDVLFVDRAHRVVKAVPAVPAWRIGPVGPGARYVVELPAGSLAASRTTVGDELAWEQLP